MSALEVVKSLWNTPGKRRIWIGLVALLALVFPTLVNSYWTDVGFFFLIYTMLGLSLNFILGGAGLYNLGHAAFYAVGAYTTGILSTQFGVPMLLLIPVAAMVAAAFAYVITKPILHLRGDYLLIVTIGFAEILRIALTNNVFGVTGGPNGILGIARHKLLGFTFVQPIHYYYLALAFVVLTIFVAVRLERSRIGRAWDYIREDELAASAMGIDTTKYKALSFVIGAALAGIAGNLYAGKMTVIDPESFNFWESVVIFAIVILGGTGSIPGVIVGAFGMVVLPEIFRELQDWRMLVFGAAMVVLMIFRPEGLWPNQRWRMAMHGDEEDVKPVAAELPGQTGMGG